MTDEPILSIDATGDAVRRLQGLLIQAGFDPGPVDGGFGMKTEAAVKAFQRAKGLEVDGVVGPLTWAALDKPSGDMRRDIVANALWGVANEPKIHYQQLRPIDGIGHIHKLPLKTDCSGFVTLCYNWAGAPDPNGQGYNGLGYTGTLLNHLDQITADQGQAGDLVVIGPGTGDHVVVIVVAGTDPEVVSHGAEGGPTRHHLSVDHRTPKRFLRSRGLLPTVAFDEELLPEQVTLPVDLSTATNAPSDPPQPLCPPLRD